MPKNIWRFCFFFSLFAIGCRFSFVSFSFLAGGMQIGLVTIRLPLGVYMVVMWPAHRIKKRRGKKLRGKREPRAQDKKGLARFYLIRRLVCVSAVLSRYGRNRITQHFSLPLLFLLYLPSKSYSSLTAWSFTQREIREEKGRPEESTLTAGFIFFLPLHVLFLRHNLVVFREKCTAAAAATFGNLLSVCI